MLFGVRLKYCLNFSRQPLQIASLISIFTVDENISIWKDGDSVLLRTSDCFWVIGWQNCAEKPLRIILYEAWGMGNPSGCTPKTRSLKWMTMSLLRTPGGSHSLVPRAHVVPSSKAPNWPCQSSTTVRDMWHPGPCRSLPLTGSPRDSQASSRKSSWRKSRLRNWSNLPFPHPRQGRPCA